MEGLYDSSTYLCRISFHCFCKRRGHQKGGRERRAGPKVTYTLIPGVPEFVESLVEADGESEGGSEDAGNEDTCQEMGEFSGNWPKWLAVASYCFVGRWYCRKRW